MFQNPSPCASHELSEGWTIALHPLKVAFQDLKYSESASIPVGRDEQ
jgi:hypothetical protein